MLSKAEERDMGEWLNTDNTTPRGPLPTMKTFSSGAKSTVKKPWYHLLPQRALALCAGRFQYGAERHGEKNYQKGAEDKEFITDRINHMIEHSLKFAESRKTSDLAAILCNAAILAELGADKDKDGADGKGAIPV